MPADEDYSNGDHGNDDAAAWVNARFEPELDSGLSSAASLGLARSRERTASVIRH